MRGISKWVDERIDIIGIRKTLLDRKAQGEIPSGVLGVDDVFSLSEVRAGFETQGIRIAALS